MMIPLMMHELHTKRQFNCVNLFSIIFYSYLFLSILDIFSQHEVPGAPLSGASACSDLCQGGRNVLHKIFVKNGSFLCSQHLNLSL